jgi:hypothetical protein
MRKRPTRRDLLQAGGTIAGGAFLARLVDSTTAGAATHGSEPPFLSQRSVVNLGFLFENNYAFINHLLQADNAFGPIAHGGWFTSGQTFPALIDANGWPNNSAADNQLWGCQFRVPDPSNFSGPYVLTWQGDGQVGLLDGVDESLRFKVVSSSGVKILGNGAYINSSSGTTARVVFSIFASSGNKPRLITCQINRTGSLGNRSTGLFVKNIKLFREVDESHQLAGKIFRAPFKQSLVDLNPSAIRFLNWMDGSNGREYRFENRALPTTAAYNTASNWPISPVYASAASGINQYTLAAATPTTSNPRTTPASLQHGEVAEVLFANSNVRGGVVSVTAMTNANPCEVTTSPSHGFSNGDQVVHWAMSGMGKLVFFPVTVANVTPSTYTIGINTSNKTNYPPYTGGGVVSQHITIDVGGRGAKPIAWTSGDAPFSIFGNFIQGGQYYSMVYDKNIAVLGDGNGNLVYGAWMMPQSPGGPSASTPLEIMVALVNEVNDLSVSQGINNPVHMWLPLSVTSLCSMDSDYSSASDYAVNAVDVIVNPSSTQRTIGYSELTARAKLFLEYGNETWNSAGGITGTPYLARMGRLRWPASPMSNYIDMYALRSTIIMRAVKATSDAKRIVCVLGGMGIAGFSVSSLNYLRCFGSATPGRPGNFYSMDTITVSGSFGTPISNHDAFCIATYFDPDNSYLTGSGKGSFSDDSAMYAGTAPYSGPNQTQAITNFVAKVKTGAGGGQCIDDFLNDSLKGRTAVYSAAMAALGKFAISYEGGPDWPTAAGSKIGFPGHTLTAADSAFVTAVLNSTQWRDAQIAYFARTSQLAGSAMPSVYIYIGALGTQRWAYCQPDTYALNGGVPIEGQNLLNSPVWVGMGARNQSLAQ